MTKMERKHQLEKRILIALAIGTTALISAISITAFHKPTEKTITDSICYADGWHNEYTIGAFYNGNGTFIDSEGNIWEISGEFTEGKLYTLYMRDNGTETPVDDACWKVR